MIYTHTIGRIGKDCQVITGTHGTFMAVDIAVDEAGSFSWRELSPHHSGKTDKARATRKSQSMRTASLS